MALNDAVDLADASSAAARASRSSRRAPSGPTPGRCSGRCRGCCGAGSSPTRSTTSTACSRRSTACWSRRRPVASWSRPASASGSTTRRGRMRVYEGLPIVPALEAAGFEPDTVDVVAMSHLHFDHAGGLLRTRRLAGVPARDGSSPSRPSGRSRSATTRGSSPRTSSPSCGSSATGAPRAGPTASASSCPASRSCRPAATRRATRRSSCGARGRGADRGLLRRPVHAAVGREPALGDGVRRLPARLGRSARASCSPRPPTRTGSSCCRTSRAAGRPPRARPRPLPVRAGLTDRPGIDPPMVFSSVTFLFLFLPAVLVAYHLLPRPARNVSSSPRACCSTRGAPAGSCSCSSPRSPGTTSSAGGSSGAMDRDDRGGGAPVRWRSASSSTSRRSPGSSTRTSGSIRLDVILGLARAAGHAVVGRPAADRHLVLHVPLAELPHRHRTAGPRGTSSTRSTSRCTSRSSRSSSPARSSGSTRSATSSCAGPRRARPFAAGVYRFAHGPGQEGPHRRHRGAGRRRGLRDARPAQLDDRRPRSLGVVAYAVQLYFDFSRLLGHGASGSR